MSGLTSNTLLIEIHYELYTLSGIPSGGPPSCEAPSTTDYVYTTQNPWSCPMKIKDKRKILCNPCS